MRLQCPFCGDRDSAEFTPIGEMARRPDRDDASKRESFEAVYLRDNLMGRHVELWYHAFGCRSWLKVTRDTRTHEIFAVELARPEVA